MPRIQYEPWNPGLDALTVVQWANDIARSYAAQGYDLTLRQLYYQGVSRDLIPNTHRRLLKTISDNYESVVAAL